MNPITTQILEELAITNIMIKFDLRYKDARLVYENPDIVIGKPNELTLH